MRVRWLGVVALQVHVWAAFVADYGRVTVGLHGMMQWVENGGLAVVVNRALRPVRIVLHIMNWFVMKQNMMISYGNM